MTLVLLWNTAWVMSQLGTTVSFRSVHCMFGVLTFFHALIMIMDYGFNDLLCLLLFQSPLPINTLIVGLEQINLSPCTLPPPKCHNGWVSHKVLNWQSFSVVRNYRQKDELWHRCCCPPGFSMCRRRALFGPQISSGYTHTCLLFLFTIHSEWRMCSEFPDENI